MGWIVLGSWIGAVVLALVVFGFVLYEVRWKTQRLRREAARLQALAERAQGLQAEAATLQARATEPGPG